MRLLHTSDWHLGRAFHGVGMLAHQRDFLEHLVEVIRRERVDLLVVSGDVFDRALPSVDAVAAADEGFARLAATGVRVVVSSGNHDSGRRLGLNARLIDAAGVHFRTVADQVDVPVLLDDQHGPVAVYALPYLEADVLHEAWSLPDRSHEAALTEAMRRVRADLAARHEIDPGIRSVVLAHAFVAGAEPSESERDISVGGVSRTPASVFDGVDYVALGHLHRPAVLTDRVRYSGSPLAYSFSEAGQDKGSWLVDLTADGSVRGEFVAAPVPRRLARISGTIDSILADPRHDADAGCWLQVTLTDPARPLRALERLRERFPHTLVVHFEPDGATVGSRRLRRPAAGLSDHQVSLDFVAQVRGRPADDAESAILCTACEAAAPDPDADVVVR